MALADEQKPTPGAESLHFTVDSHLLLELGARLVTRKSIAVGELVKNSYDADATKVTVRLIDVTKPGGTIVIQDDGQGMSFEGLVSGWMRIATDEKVRRPFSTKFGRPRTGSKGIGRFACRVLADSLSIDTTAQTPTGAAERTQVTIDWETFKPGTRVENVPVQCVREENTRNAVTGVTLTLGDARGTWTREDILELRKDLMTLVSPSTTLEDRASQPSISPDPGFEITLEAPEFEGISGPISEQFLKHSWARLSGQVDEHGTASYALTIRKTSRKHRLAAEKEFAKVGKLSFDIDYFVWRRDYLAGLDISVRDAQKLGKEQGGVRIYLDGFRVFPYGDPGDDWLGLDADRGRRLTTFRVLSDVDKELARPALFIPGNNQLFGAVLLSRTRNADLQLTVTRDRLLDNEAFEQLRDFVRLGIEWMTVQYARWQAEEQGKKPRKGPELSDPTTPLERAIQEVAQRERELGPELVAELTQALELARDAVRQREEDRITELAMLRVLATTGAMVTILDHELRAMIDDVRSITIGLKRKSQNLSDKAIQGEISASTAKLEEWADTIEQYGLQLAVLTGREARERRRILPLRPVIEGMAHPFARYLREYGIAFANEVPPDLRLPAMYQCEIYSLFINLLTNSAKALRSVTERKIAVQAKKLRSRIQILFLDTGPGVALERREEVFRPFVSDSEPDPMLGTGTGLGLKIVRDIVEIYGGTIQFVDPPSSWGACVEIILPTD